MMDRNCLETLSGRALIVSLKFVKVAFEADHLMNRVQSLAWKLIRRDVGVEILALLNVILLLLDYEDCMSKIFIRFSKGVSKRCQMK